MWRNPPRGGLRQILAQLGDYDLTWDEVRVRDDILSPSPASWIRLQDTHFQRITTLDLDFFTIRPLNIVSTIAESCPPLHLPRLTTLRVSIDLLDDQFEIFKRFMQPTVTVLDLQVWEPRFETDRTRSPRKNRDSLTNFDYRARMDRDLVGNGDRDDAWEAVVAICPDIQSKMPRLTHLLFFMNDITSCFFSYTEFSNMILGLQELNTLELAVYHTELSFLESISAHPTLRTITTSQQSWPLRAWKGDEQTDFLRLLCYGFESQGNPHDPELVYGLPSFAESVPTFREDAFRNLTTLQLTTSVCELAHALRKWPGGALNMLQRFDINTSFFLVRSREDLQELMQLIAKRFTMLNALSIGLLEGKIQAEADLLHPLTTLTRLASLEFRASQPSCIPVRDWPALLKFWPHLEVLVLDNTPRPYGVMGSGLRPGDAPLDQVLKTFHDHCPKLRVLSLHVDGTLALGNAVPSLPVPKLLRALELVLPCLVPQEDIIVASSREACVSETGPLDVAPAGQLPADRGQTSPLDRDRMLAKDASRTDCLAEYLHAVLPPGCGLHVMDQGDFGLCDTLPGAKVEGEDDECYWHDILNEWSVLHEVEGKECRAQRCMETRGDILVPVYVVPVCDSVA